VRFGVDTLCFKGLLKRQDGSIGHVLNVDAHCSVGVAVEDSLFLVAAVCVTVIYTSCAYLLVA
jgi:hypothetical protein